VDEPGVLSRAVEESTPPRQSEDPLKLSVDVTAVPARPVGAGRYTLELVQQLGRRPEVELRLMARRHDAQRWKEVAPGASVVAAAPKSRPLRLAWEQVRLPALLARDSVTVHHGPHYTMPERSRVPVTVTIHDLSFFEAPEWHERSKVVVFRRAIEVAARRAAVLICPSQTTADELARWCPTESPIFVARHGVDVSRFATDDPEVGADAKRLATLDQRLVGGIPFFVFVGTIEPRKDIPTLVRAFARVADRHREALLVLAGGAGWGGDEVERAIEATGWGARIVRTGYVDDAVVPALLRSATAAVYPAIYEGFGLPALEALACGVPLVTTSGTAMEEVAGDAATLVSPGDARGLADVLDDHLTGGIVDGAARQRGFEIVARHTWAASATVHMEAYRTAARRV
jgi:glycosyltransferase involved in cell wall biosynthesis